MSCSLIAEVSVPLLQYSNRTPTSPQSDAAPWHVTMYGLALRRAQMSTSERMLCMRRRASILPVSAIAACESCSTSSSKAAWSASLGATAACCVEARSTLWNFLMANTDVCTLHLYTAAKLPDPSKSVTRTFSISSQRRPCTAAAEERRWRSHAPGDGSLPTWDAVAGPECAADAKDAPHEPAAAASAALLGRDTVWLARLPADAARAPATVAASPEGKVMAVAP
mmetsp:Transcript_25985/g.97887  ORF Transcript_25985/g.97887 Transcript_25985/m.97887 type:complete len:225 (-) Transcript_25985:665-1339(-)